MAVESILLEAKNLGVGSLTRTALTKYLYLLDYWVAKENSGKTFIGAEWIFHHFGPYSEAIANDLDWLPTLPSINKVDVSKEGKDFSLYSLSEYAKGRTLESIGLTFDVRQNLALALKTFAHDLSGLLNFVYFETEPMEHAAPGDRLVFSNLQKSVFKTDIKPYKLPIKDRKKAEKIQALLLNIGNRWEEDHKPLILKNPPIRDAYYEQTFDEEYELDPTEEFISSVTFKNK